MTLPTPASPAGPLPVHSRHVNAAGLDLHYLECGSGDPVLLLHGWPTSSFLYRNILPAIAAAGRRAIALDLPGFGRSSKPLDVRYSFDFYARALDGFTAALGLERLGLVVHDLGGPVGLYWACNNLPRIERLALLNTLVYPELSAAVIAFGLACMIPGLRSLLTSAAGLRFAMHLGVADKHRLQPDTIAGTQAPFRTRAARAALLKSALGLSARGLRHIATTLPSLRAPVRIIYGARDRILPDVATTMRRVARDLPQATLTELPDCGHFLQEERPQEVAALLAEFFAGPAAADGVGSNGNGSGRHH